MSNARKSPGRTRLPYHKRAQTRLMGGTFSTLFVLCADARNATWGRLDALCDRYPFVGYLPGEDGGLPDPESIVFPTGARECLLIDHAGMVTAEGCMELARAADRSGMRPFCISQPSGYWRIGKRSNG